MGRVLHENLTSPELHEPKGYSTATSGQVYVADGLNSGAFEVPAAHSGWTRLSSNIPTALSTLEYQWSESLYSQIKIIFTGLRTDTDDDTLSLRVGRANGTDIADTAGDYDLMYHTIGVGGWTADGTTDKWRITGPTPTNPGLLATSSMSGEIVLHGNKSTAIGIGCATRCMYRIFGGGAITHKHAKGEIGSANWSGSPDTIQLLLGSGTFIVAGTVDIYGLQT